MPAKTTHWKASWWARFTHWARCGGGWSSFDATTGEWCCEFCHFVYCGGRHAAD